MNVKIPFQECFREKMLSGEKTMTCRFKRYGKIGDNFEAFGAIFTIDSIFRCPLGYAMGTMYKLEGFDTQREMANFWRKAHPIRNEDHHVVYAHLFRRIS